MGDGSPRGVLGELLAFLEDPVVMVTANSLSVAPSDAAPLTRSRMLVFVGDGEDDDPCLVPFVAAGDFLSPGFSGDSSLESDFMTATRGRCFRLPALAARLFRFSSSDGPRP